MTLRKKVTMIVEEMKYRRNSLSSHVTALRGNRQTDVRRLCEASGQFEEIQMHLEEIEAALEYPDSDNVEGA